VIEELEGQSVRRMAAVVAWMADGDNAKTIPIQSTEGVIHR
jgi:hypothetical protein